VAGYCVLMEKQATALLDDLTLAPPVATAPVRPRRTSVPTAPGAG
jgi:biopolymer transport protein ExbB